MAKKHRFAKAYVEITNTCNKSCSFCHGTKREPRQMTKDEFLLVLDRLKPFTEYIYLHVLGEPMSHGEILDFVRAATDIGYKVTITTNGTYDLLPLLETGVYKVQISLHSFENDDEEKKRAYVERLIYFSRLASEKGVIVSFRLWNFCEGNEENAFVQGLLSTAFGVDCRADRVGDVTLGENIFLNYATRFEWPDMEAEVVSPQFCMGLRDQIAILSDGTVVPCCLDAEGDIALGNIFSTELDEIISSHKACAIYDGFSARRATESLCKRCSYAKRFDKQL